MASPRPPSPKQQRTKSHTLSSSAQSGRSQRSHFHRTKPRRAPSPQHQERNAEHGTFEYQREAVQPARRNRPNTERRRRRSPPPPPRRQEPSNKQGRRSNLPPPRRWQTPSPSDSPYPSRSDDSDASTRSRRHQGKKVSQRKHPAWKRSRKISKFHEGGKNVTFLTYDGTYAATDKILAFIQQFDAAFGGEEFDEGSKLRQVAMYFQKFARKWWASLRINKETPMTWTECCKAIMTQFLTEHAQDDVMAEWRSLHLEKGENHQQIY